MSSDTLDLEVVAIESLTDEVRGIRLQRPDRAPLPPFLPGAHLRVTVPLPSGSDTRSYSLVNAGGDANVYEIGVKLETRGQGGSRWMHALQVGDRVRCSAPRNDFTLVDGAHEALLIAGGIGITPIYAMARALSAANPDTVEMHYGARTPELMAYRTAIEAMLGPKAHLYFDGGDPSRGMRLAEVLARPRPQRHLYVCGPRPLIEATLAEAARQGWPRSHVHFELFAAAAPARGDRPIAVTLTASGLTLQVAANQSILDAMIAAGCDPMFDCKRGECSLCAVKMTAGEAEHRDYVLSDADRAEGLFCVCVSRAKTEAITLDA